MFETARFKQLLIFLLCVLAFATPWPYIYSSVITMALCLVWLLQCRPKQVFAELKVRKMLWPWLLFFLLHVVSYTYSANKDRSLFDIEAKLSFLIFPIVVGTSTLINRAVLERIFLSFISGITAIAIFCITKAFVIYVHTSQTEQFFYHPLVSGLDANAVYQSWYAIFSITILLLYRWHTLFRGRFSRLKLPILLIQIAFLILLSSRTLLVVFFLCLIPFYVSRLFKSNILSKRKAIFIGAGALALFIVLFSTHNPIKQRYNAIINDNSNLTTTHFDPQTFNNLTLRLFLWKMGFENIKEHNLWLFGCGNGDVESLQNAKISQYGVADIYNAEHRSPLYNINLHNMYMQTLVMLGLVGLVVFLIIVLSPYFAMRNAPAHHVFLLFNITSCIYMLQEAALQTQAGIIFYTYFIVLFWAVHYSEAHFSKKTNY